MTASEDSTVTRFAGGFMILTSSLGLFFNVSVFFHFLSLEKTSFYLMCISKTISNSLVLLVYLVYNGPSALLFHIIGSDVLNRYMNQAVAYGIYIQGPLIQTLISINRFLVVWTSPRSVPRYSNPVTVATLSGFWLISIYLTVLPGASDDCKIKMVLKRLDWNAKECGNEVVDGVLEHFIHFIGSLAIVSNFFNFLVVLKLIWTSVRKSQSISSQTVRSRQKTTLRLFVQNCIQDWIYVVDMVNSLDLVVAVENEILVFAVTLGSNCFVHLADGFVMFMFNYGRRSNRKKSSTVAVSPKMTRSGV